MNREEREQEGKKESMKRRKKKKRKNARKQENKKEGKREERKKGKLSPLGPLERELPQISCSDARRVTSRSGMHLHTRDALLASNIAWISGGGVRFIFPILFIISGILSAR